MPPPCSGRQGGTMEYKCVTDLDKLQNYLGEARQTDAVGNICERFHIERSSAYNKKNRALARLALLLYGK